MTIVTYAPPAEAGAEAEGAGRNDRRPDDCRRRARYDAGGAQADAADALFREMKRQTADKREGE